MLSVPQSSLTSFPTMTNTNTGSRCEFFVENYIVPLSLGCSNFVWCRYVRKTWRLSYVWKEKRCWMWKNVYYVLVK